jgi:hypothetical protein
MEQNETLNAAIAHADGGTLLALGTWLGRHQAFALLASKCSAADAECLREIHDNKYYKAIGLSWEEFCSRHAGVDRKPPTVSSNASRNSVKRISTFPSSCRSSPPAIASWHPT